MLIVVANTSAIRNPIKIFKMGVKKFNCTNMIGKIIAINSATIITTIILPTFTISNILN